jgi:glycosyltransferase involved in cell wall biosynthesis
MRPAPACPAVLFFGRIQEYKGVDILVRAARSLAPEIKVIIAGPGRLSPSLAAEIRGSERFELHDRFLADEEVSTLFRRASVTVLPYRDATQSSVPLISASFGVPIVATSVGAFVDEIPLLGGLLVPPCDHQALAKAITQAIGLSAVHPPELHFSSLADRYLEMYAAAVAR